MCEDCVKQEYPDRGTVCLDSGAYLANLAGCQGCGHKDTLHEANKTTSPTHSEVDTAQETIEYDHVCVRCCHVVAHHTHHFWLEEGYQHYEMSCLLCGQAEDARSCLPDDPRFEATLF